MKYLGFLQLLTFIICLVSFGIHAAVAKGSRNNVKLFVFGDSYADTGNTVRPASITASSAWKVPYGITFPRKPDGRFSDGFVFTDFLAKYMGLKQTPVTYKSWKNHGLSKYLTYGMNFAYGATGVFDIPTVPYPNMTAQIDIFEQLVNQQLFTSADLQNSVVLVQASGDDYIYYVAQHASLDGITAFIAEVVAQIVRNVRRIYSTGVKQVLVSGLEPIGCLPVSTQSNNYSECNLAYNIGANFHNSLLRQAITDLNNETRGSYTRFIFLDMYDSFMAVINNQTGSISSGKFNFGNPLPPCCAAVNSSYYCASSAADGQKLYSLCNDRESSFFWDTFHPTHEGWRAVTLLLRDSLNELQGI